MADDEGLILPEGAKPKPTEDEEEGYDVKAPERLPVRMAFLVYVLPDGHAVASTGFAEDEGVEPIEALSRVLDKIVVTDGDPDPYTIARACEEVVRDTERSLLVNTMLNAQMQLGRQLSVAQQEAAQQQRILDMIQGQDALKNQQRRR